MKKILTILFVTLFSTLMAKGQDLFFIGENSFTSTNIITLQSNSEDVANLDLIFAKDGKVGFVGVSTNTAYTNETFVDKLIIYLEDGSVVTCADLVESENVDRSAKAVFYLTNEDLNKMKKSDIHTVRYTLNFMLAETLYSASNKGNKTSTIVTEFFGEGISTAIDHTKYNSRFTREEAEREAREGAERQRQAEEQQKINEINSGTAGAFANSGVGSGGAGSGDGKSQGKTFPGGNQGVPTGDANANKYGPGGSGNGEQGSGVSYSLSGRTASSLPKPKYPGNDAGIVVVKVTVDKYGKVTSAEPGARGTTIANQDFWNEAKQAALKAKFNLDNNAPAFQQGTISYRFVLD